MRDCRSGASPGRARRAATNAPQSRTALSDHLVDGGDVGLPRLALLGQDAAALGGQPIETALAMPRLLDPPALDQAAVLETKQCRVEGRQGEAEAAAGARLDELADLIAVPRLRLQQRQHQHLGAALLQFGAEHRASLLKES